MPLTAPRAIRWTREEYYRMAEGGYFQGRRVERVRGEIIEMTPQNSPHATGVTLAARLFERRLGHLLTVRIQLPLELGKDSDPEPDLAIVEGGPRDYSKAHPRHALLVIEVAESSLDYDRGAKGSLYAEAGIPEYWIVNLPGRCVEVHRAPAPIAGGSGIAYGSLESLPAGAMVSPLCAPGASIGVDELLP